MFCNVPLPSSMDTRLFPVDADELVFLVFLKIIRGKGLHDLIRRGNVSFSLHGEGVDHGPLKAHVHGYAAGGLRSGRLRIDSCRIDVDPTVCAPSVCRCRCSCFTCICFLFRWRDWWQARYIISSYMAI